MLALVNPAAAVRQNQGGCFYHAARAAGCIELKSGDGAAAPVLRAAPATPMGDANGDADGRRQ